jgi:hypothetical protein
MAVKAGASNSFVVQYLIVLCGLVILSLLCVALFKVFRKYLRVTWEGEL